MPRRAHAALVFALTSASPTAFAHGIEAVFQALVIAGAVVGLIGGATTGALRFKFVPGLAVSLGVLFFGGLVFAVMNLGPTSDPLGDIGAMALLLAMFAALPLGAVFAIAFALASLLRNRFWAQRRTG